MSLPQRLRELLPDDTVEAWAHVATVAPPTSVLMGGTALAVHLAHRVSRDLNVFTEDAFDADRLARALGNRATFAATRKGEGTLNGVLGATKVQFLWARGQVVLDEPTPVAGLPVGAVADILATKVKVLADRGELRDYFDLLCIERDTNLSFEAGIELYLARYQLDAHHSSIATIVRALGYFDGVEDDPSLNIEMGPDIFATVQAYWQRRQPQIIAHLETHSAAPAPRRRPPTTKA